MAYDESENPEDLLRFYNFGTMSEQDFEAATVDTVSNEENELVLVSGERLGHRRFMKYYKQKVRRPSQEEEVDPLSITEGDSAEVIEPRNRKERRSKLAITNGTQMNGDMLRRLPEVVQVQQQHWQRQSSKKSNLIATTRLRIQNPI